MSVVGLIVILVILAGIAWLVNTKIPGQSTIKTVINVVLIVVAIVLVLSAFGVWDEVRSVQVPKL